MKREVADAFNEEIVGAFLMTETLIIDSLTLGSPRMQRIRVTENTQKGAQKLE